MRLALAVTLLASLCARPEPVEIRSCLVVPPPERATFATTREGCRGPLVCLADEDARAMAGELERRRSWDATAWALCGPAE